mmetsp:Transcript_39646/g.74345  ORF Transcript_39646/g.74345 Transcript_39646/m.74345 type:complete len:194 (-) Transcript_39646:35-616(-)
MQHRQCPAMTTLLQHLPWRARTRRRSTERTLLFSCGDFDIPQCSVSQQDSKLVCQPKDSDKANEQLLCQNNALKNLNRMLLDKLHCADALLQKPRFEEDNNRGAGDGSFVAHGLQEVEKAGHFGSKALTLCAEEVKEGEQGKNCLGSRALSRSCTAGNNGGEVIPIGTFVKLHSLQNKVLNGQVGQVTSFFSR